MLKVWARFIRLPNIFTAMADPVAGLAIGYCILNALFGKSDLPISAVPVLGKIPQLPLPGFPWQAVWALMLSSALVYAAGIVFNDLADLKGDLQRRPERALPSGAISIGRAVLAGLLLAGGGIGLGFLVDPQTGLGVCCLFGAVLLYDFLLKRNFVTAALGMGLCRSGNLLLGMSVPLLEFSRQRPEAGLHPETWVLIPILYGLQIAFLTTLSWTEESFPLRLPRPWDKPPEGQTVEEAAAAAAAAKPSTLKAKLSLWAWVAVMAALAQTSTSAVAKNVNPILTIPGLVQFVSLILVFIAVYMQFSLFLKSPIRKNLGLTIRNGVLSIPLFWAGYVFAFATHDRDPDHANLMSDYHQVSLLLLALYLPLLAAAKWLNSKDA